MNTLGKLVGEAIPCNGAQPLAESHPEASKLSDPKSNGMFLEMSLDSHLYQRLSFPALTKTYRILNLQLLQYNPVAGSEIEVALTARAILKPGHIHFLHSTREPCHVFPCIISLKPFNKYVRQPHLKPKSLNYSRVGKGYETSRLASGPSS